MNKYKVSVYAICKNEEKFVKRWYESMSEADEIYVLDTGSTDNSVKLLKECGAHVTVKKFKNWRFDEARNCSLNLVSSDTEICVCTDLDEVFNKGWRKELEKIWDDKVTRVRYDYNWSLDRNNHPIVNFYIEKIHKRDGYHWINPVHEVLSYNGKETVYTTDNITLNHYPDNKKSRSSYLPLLELSIKEDPFNDRNMHYLGREYMYYKRYQEAIDTLIRHLSLKSATWKDERCASMRFIGRCYKYLHRYEEAKMWLDKAIEEAPYLRDAYMERALLAYELQDWLDVEKYSLRALDIEKNPKSYINEIFTFDGTVYDLLSLSCFYQKHYHEALKYIELALQFKPKDKRLQNNKKIFLMYINDKSTIVNL